MTKRGHRVYYRHTEEEHDRVPAWLWVAVFITAAVVIAATFAHFAGGQ